MWADPYYDMSSLARYVLYLSHSQSSIDPLPTCLPSVLPLTWKLLWLRSEKPDLDEDNSSLLTLEFIIFFPSSLLGHSDLLWLEHKHHYQLASVYKVKSLLLRDQLTSLEVPRASCSVPFGHLSPHRTSLWERGDDQAKTLKQKLFSWAPREVSQVWGEWKLYISVCLGII